jgi:hypothetical protein
VSRVVSALKPHDDIRFLRQEIDYLPLALVTPLGTDDYQRRHLIAKRMTSSSIKTL